MPYHEAWLQKPNRYGALEQNIDATRSPSMTMTIPWFYPSRSTNLVPKSQKPSKSPFFFKHVVISSPTSSPHVPHRKPSFFHQIPSIFLPHAHIPSIFPCSSSFPHLFSQHILPILPTVPTVPFPSPPQGLGLMSWWDVSHHPTLGEMSFPTDTVSVLVMDSPKIPN